MNDLPEDYIYKIIENNERRFIFRIKNVSDKETALAWLSAYENKSKFTWRKSRTYPNAGKIYVFHGDFKCHHNTDSRCRRLNKRISKHTGCEATLQIKVKRYVEKSKSQCPDIDAKDYPCIVILGNKHNHSQFSAEVLRFRDIAEMTKNKLLYYYQQGFSASSAHHALEDELLLTEENFEHARLDHSLLPSVSVIQHLFNRKFSVTDGTRDGNQTKLKIKREKSDVKDTTPSLSCPALETELNEENFESTKSDSSLLQSVSTIQPQFNRKFPAVDGTKDGNPPKLQIKRKKSDVKGVRKKRTVQLHQDNKKVTHQDVQRVQFRVFEGKLHPDNKKVFLDELKHDMIFKVGDKELYAHQDVLRAQSRVLEAMLSHDIIKENRVVIEVYDCDPPAMVQFLSYVYSGEIETLDLTDMLNLFYIADKYDMEHLKEKCCDLIKKSLSLSNIYEVIQFALNHSDSGLLDSATEYFGDNALDILHSVEWQSFLKHNSDAANELLIKYFEKSKT